MTRPELGHWPASNSAYRRLETSAVIGSGDAVWERAAGDVLRWRVKTASGFNVESTGPVLPGDRVDLTARIFGLEIVEPVEVVSVLKEPCRVGFAYRTLPGHPVSGEEAFIVGRRGDDVRLSIRSLTQAAPQQPWRALFSVASDRAAGRAPALPSCSQGMISAPADGVS